MHGFVTINMACYYVSGSVANRQEHGLLSQVDDIFVTDDLCDLEQASEFLCALAASYLDGSSNGIYGVFISLKGL